MIRIVKTACPLDCFDACGVIAEVEGDRILRIGGDAEHPITRGALCKKVNSFLADRQYNAERITHPLVRARGGSWRAIAWDEALDLAAQKLGRGARAARQPVGALPPRQRVVRRAQVHGQPLLQPVRRGHGGRRALLRGRGRLRHAPGVRRLPDPRSAGSRGPHQPVPDLGAQPRRHEHPHDAGAQECPARGALAVVIDPVRTKTVRYATTTRCIRGRAATASSRWAWPRIILEQRPVDLDRLHAIGDAAPSYSTSSARSRSTPSRRRTDLDGKTIEWLALEYCRHASPRRSSGRRPAAVHARPPDLPAHRGARVLSGNVGIPGGGVNLTNWPWREIRSPELLAEAARTAPPRTMPVSQLAAALNRATDPPVTTALFTRPTS